MSSCALQVTPLPAVDSSSLLPHIDLVPPHMRKGAEAVEMAQLLLGPLLAYMVSIGRRLVELVAVHVLGKPSYAVARHSVWRLSECALNVLQWGVLTGDSPLDR